MGNGWVLMYTEVVKIDEEDMIMSVLLSSTSFPKSTSHIYRWTPGR